MDLKKAHLLLDSLFASGKEVDYERRDTIFEYNQESQVACRIVDGCVKVFSYTRNGNERIHFLYGAGDVFPMINLLPEQREEVGFMALTQVRVMVKPVDEVLKRLDVHPYAMAALLEQQSHMQSRIFNLNLGSSEQRLVHWLLSLAKRFGVMSSDHYTVNLPLTIQEIADMVRLTRETTGKTLSQFEQRRCIILGRQQILIYPERLREIIDSPPVSATAS